MSHHSNPAKGLVIREAVPIFVVLSQKDREVQTMETYHKEDIRWGNIYYADLRSIVGSEQGGIRPVVVIQNDVGNRYSPSVIVAPITSRLGKAQLPTHINMAGTTSGLHWDSVIMLEQLRTLDRSRLRDTLAVWTKMKYCASTKRWGSA